MISIKYSIDSKYSNYANYYLLGLSKYYKLQKGNEPVSGAITKFTTDKTFYIDAYDGDGVNDSYVAFSDFYFKSHMCRNKTYDPKVLPIYNGSARLNKNTLNALKQLRNIKPEKDVFCVSRIWGGVEHITTIFEQLSKLKCSKTLHGILTGSVNDAKSRLDIAGVSCNNQAYTENKCWNGEATSKLVILRHGKYMCCPWNWIELMAMGACIVLDHEPDFITPFPLIKNVNYLSLEIDRNSIPTYYTICDRIYGFLEGNLVNEIRQNNIEYFDRHCSPDAIANYITNTIGGL